MKKLHAADFLVIAGFGFGLAAFTGFYSAVSAQGFAGGATELSQWATPNQVIADNLIREVASEILGYGQEAGSDVEKSIGKMFEGLPTDDFKNPTEEPTGASAILYSASISELGLVGDNVPAAAILIASNPAVTDIGCRAVCDYRFQILGGKFTLVAIEALGADTHQYTLIGTGIKENNLGEFFSSVRFELLDSPTLMASGSTKAPENWALRGRIENLASALIESNEAYQGLWDVANGATAEKDTLFIEVTALKAQIAIHERTERVATAIALNVCNDNVPEADDEICDPIEGLISLEEARQAIATMVTGE